MPLRAGNSVPGPVKTQLVSRDAPVKAKLITFAAGMLSLCVAGATDVHAAQAISHAKTIPFKVDRGKSGKWNSLFVKNATTVTAISGTTANGVRGLWAVDGRLARAYPAK